MAASSKYKGVELGVMLAAESSIRHNLRQYQITTKTSHTYVFCTTSSAVMHWCHSIQLIDRCKLSFNIKI